MSSRRPRYPRAADEQEPVTLGGFGRVSAWLGLLAQVAFVLTWIDAATWQGPRYSVVSDSISDLYAVTAPHAAR